MKNIFYQSPHLDAYMNLAIDEHLLNTAKPGDMYLLLYVNKSAVIIGRNQNPWRECSLEKMEQGGVQLARRISGGGAVYHDMGNLNYSFIAGEGRDVTEQLDIVITALKRFGISAEASGRNDICVNGRKISGIAWSRRGENNMRHGTLLINTNLNDVERYLTPSTAKLKAKGVASIRKRVCNLSDCSSEITVASMVQTLQNEFGSYHEHAFTHEDERAIDKLRERNASDSWTLGVTPRFDYTVQRRYDWGMAELCVSTNGGIITGVKVYTDALDTVIPQTFENALIGKCFDPEVIEGMII